MDWVSKTPEDQRPKVRKYCLMSAKEAFTDWHVDMGGSSVWYHVVEGAKVFWFAPPSHKRIWTRMPSGSRLHLNPRPGSATSWGRARCRASRSSRATCCPLPAGWLHAVYTPEDPGALGGNYLHSSAFATQLAVFSLEKRCRVDAECRFPHWVETVAYGAAADARHPAVSANDAGARRLLSGNAQIVVKRRGVADGVRKAALEGRRWRASPWTLLL